jgi:UDP-2,4-diacetamido-2,4,6-trideoxy-beta-L-altropyranose hydrolase
MRCLALAQAWQADGGSVMFVGNMTPILENQLAAENIKVRNLKVKAGSLKDADRTVRHAKALDVSWVVVDGYHFGGDYQHRLRESGLRVLFIDDCGHADRYEADLVLNQNIDAEEGLYANRAEHTDLLLGPTFALLRKEFWPWREPRREIRREAGHILITLGGVDPDNITTDAVEALGSLEASGVQGTAVIGGSNPHEDAIRAAVESARVPIDVRQNVDDMAELMVDSDIAVSAGGSTCWELAFMGVPNVVVILAENQKGIARGLDEADTAANLGWHEKVSTPEIGSAVGSMVRNDQKRHRMAEKAQALVDGWGAERVLSTMAHEPFLRPAQEQDCELLWKWANDPVVRERSYNSNPIPLEEHEEWFLGKLRDPSSRIYVAEEGEEPIGKVRFDVEGEAAVVSVIVDPEYRGEGYGTEIIRRGTEKFLHGNGDAWRVNAFIKETNKPSVRAFKKAGYVYKEDLVKSGDASYRFAVAKNELDTA